MVTFGIGIYAAYARDETPSARWLIGVSMAYMFCSIFADFGSGLGSGFAVLIMLSALLYQGEDVLKAITKRGGPPQKKKRSKGAKRSSKTRAGSDDPGDYPD